MVESKSRYFGKKLAFVGWNGAGKVNRIVHEIVWPRPETNTLDLIVRTLDYPHRLSEWDVEWCERDECYYINQTGDWSGRIYLHQLVDSYRETYWAADDIQLCSGGNTRDQITPEEISKLGYDRVVLQAPPVDLTMYAEEESCYWCSACDDMIPSHDLCDHMYWCDECGMVVTLEDRSSCGHDRNIDD